jgi:7-carboxy-7-deazaguanine synthase
MIQHNDINIGPASYKHLNADELLITKVFYTLQGEGPYAGTPAVFVRLAGCNRGDKTTMGCKFCDTAFYFHKGRVATFDELILEMGYSWSSGLPKHPLVVITGGEPMMQDNLVGLIFKLHGARYYDVQIESNGDRLAHGYSEMIEEVYGRGSVVTLVVSPKVTKSGYHDLNRKVYEAASALKFVISADPASPYYNVPEYAYKFRLDEDGVRDVFLSPMTVYKRAADPDRPVSAWDTSLVDHELTKTNYRRAAELAIRNGFRVSMQQHLFFCVE